MTVHLVPTWPAAAAKLLALATFDSECVSLAAEPGRSDRRWWTVRTQRVALNLVPLEAEGKSVEGMRVARWAKYGHVRLYVTDEDGRRVGWVDLKTGAETLEVPHLADAYRAALADYAQTDRDHPGTEPTAGPQVQAVQTSGLPEAGALRTVEAGPADVGPGAAPERLAVDLSLLPPPAPLGPNLPVPSSGPPPEPPAVAPPPTPNWVDLAANRPGQAARAQAEAELAAMKDRTRVGTFLARLVDAKTDERAWRVGADGEETVGSRLEKLVPRGWRVLHAVPVGSRGSDIDHVLIGPGGVYTLNTKTHPGGSVWVGRYAIKVNGHSQPYLRNSRFEADRASRLLTAAVGWPVHVRPVLVFLTGTLIPNVTIKQQPDDVLVLDRTDIPGAFKRAKTRLSGEQVAEVFEQARRSTTWGTSDPQ